MQFIVASVIIGGGIFAGDSEALEVAGPGGALIGLMLIGILAICVMECVSELVQLFPVPNAIVEYIKAFVDEDLAWCAGLAYW
jgi:yeast amino acid transporter